MRHLLGVRGGYEGPTRGTRWVQDTYKGNEAGTRFMRHVQGVRGGYEATARGMRRV